MEEIEIIARTWQSGLLTEHKEASDAFGRIRKAVKAAQHRLHLTAFGVGMLAFLAGFVVCWLAFVR